VVLLALVALVDLQAAEHLPPIHLRPVAAAAFGPQNETGSPGQILHKQFK
jgi:hypothetical protein